MMPANKWAIPPPRRTLVVGIADMVASNDSSAMLVTYSLGSCLGITVYDPVNKAGGLLHIMLPDSKINAEKAVSMPAMFVDTGVPRLFHAVYNLGGDRRRVVVKVAGGAQLLDEHGVFDIGKRNLEAFTALLAYNGYAAQAQDVGGMSSRTLRLDLTTGDVTIKSAGFDTYFL
jgi:chemotaxis protein CheD